MVKSKAKTFCALPWLALEVRTEGTMAVCCNSREVLRDQEGQALQVGRNSLADGMRSPDRLRLRELLGQGKKPSNCDRCWQEERSGIVSRREISNHVYADEIAKLEKNSDAFSNKPPGLDLKFSNICNQKCRICGPGSSTLWGAEVAKMNPGQRPILETSWGKNNPELWQEFISLLPTLTRLDLFGGEPFLIPECEKLMELAVQLGVAGQIELRLSSNASIFPEKLVGLMSQFKKVAVFLSLDGIGEQFEYQRHPARWETALQVYRKFKATPYFAGILLTVSSLNIFDVPEYLQFWRDIGETKVFLSSLFSPDFLCTNILPPKAKNAVAARLFASLESNETQKEEILRLMMFMHQGQRDDLWPQFVQVTKSLDRFRQEDFAQIFPQYYQIIKDTFEENL